MRQGGWRAVSGRLLRSWRWSGALLFVLCLTNVPSLIQREMFEGASLAFLPRAGLLAEEAVRVAGRSEDRRVGNECLPRWSPYQQTKKSVLL